MADEGEDAPVAAVAAGFGLPEELAAVLPADLFEQLDVTRKITSIERDTVCARARHRPPQPRGGLEGDGAKRECNTVEHRQEAEQRRRQAGSFQEDAYAVTDMFCVDALAVAAELAIPAYFFFASAVGGLAVMLHLPYYYPAASSSFQDMGTALLRFPGVPPIRALDMSTTMFDRESDIAKERLR